MTRNLLYYIHMYCKLRVTWQMRLEDQLSRAPCDWSSDRYELSDDTRFVVLYIHVLRIACHLKDATRRSAFSGIMRLVVGQVRVVWWHTICCTIHTCIANCVSPIQSKSVNGYRKEHTRTKRWQKCDFIICPIDNCPISHFCHLFTILRFSDHHQIY